MIVFKNKKTLFKILFLCFSTLSFSNNIIDEQLDKILNNEILCNEKKLEAISSILNNEKNIEDLKIALYYHDISKVFYKAKDIPVAINCLNNAIEIRRKHVQSYPELLKKSLFNIGLFYKKIGNIQQSLKAYYEILNLGDEDRYHAKVYSLFGLHYTNTGDFAKALDNFEKAERYFLNNKLNRDLFLSHLNSSRLYTQMDRIKYTQEIINHLEKADSINLKNEISKPNESFIINQRLGNVFLEMNKYKLSEKKLDKALIIAKHQNDSSKLSLVYNSLGKLFFDSDRKLKVLSTFKTAFFYAPNNTYKAMVSNNLGDYYSSQNNIVLAEKSYKKALSYLCHNSDNSLPSIEVLSILPKKLDALGYLKDLSNFYLNHKKLQEALTTLLLADKLIDVIRLESTENVSKLFWRTHSSDLYMKGVEISYLLNNPEKAFYFMEKNKVLLLLEDLTSQQARLVSEIPDDKTLKELDYKNQIRALETLLLDEKKTSNKNQIKNNIFDLKQEKQSFLDSLRVDFPNYFKLRKEINILKTTKISRSVLKDSTAIVEFMLDEEQGYTLIKTNKALRLVKIDSVKVLQKDILELKSLTSKPFYNNNDFVVFNNISNRVYVKLFSKIENLIEDKSQLIIIPDYKLSYIPIEILQSSISQDPLSPNYLLFDYNISYVFSISHLIKNNDKKRSPTKNFLGVAPINFQNGLNRLGNSEEEIKRINNLFDGELMIGESATKSAFKEKSNQFNIIHISSHANFNREKTTWLWFYDKKMKQSELYAMRNQADLVVLSACKTSEGELIKGEGLNSLSRGFFNSGAKSVLSSLWNTNDKSNSSIMTEFYNKLNNNISKDIALSQAKKTYLKTHFGIEKSPYYWASNIINGSVETYLVKNKKPSYLYLIPVVLLFLGIVFYFKRTSFSSR